MSQYIASRHLLRSKIAFTIVEVLVASAIAATLMTTIYGLYSFGMKVSNKGLSETSLQMEVRTLLSEMCEDLHSASEIIEFKSNKIRFKKFFKKTGNDLQVYGNNNTQVVGYEITRENGKAVIKRYIDIDGHPVVEASNIDSNAFIGYMEIEKIKEHKNGKKTKTREFIPYDTFMGDSKERSKISLIRIHLHIKQKKEAIDIITKVELPYIHGHNLEPNWNRGIK
jgi:hypothetical protein